jgi:PHD/YefM family antitoxin component YafN of YafNO toxin-antitoxin module
MKFLSVRELRNRPGRVWSELKKEELVLTSNGKPVGILLGVKEGRIEETLAALRRARAAAAVSRMRRRAAAAGTDTLSSREIEAEVRAARRRGKP